MPQYKLTYFQLRGKAEAIKMTFAVAGVDFEDVRVSMEDWVANLEHFEYVSVCSFMLYYNTL